MRLGDYIVLLSMTLNALACALYAYQRHGWNVFYFLCALA